MASLDELLGDVATLERFAKERRDDGTGALRFEDAGQGSQCLVGFWHRALTAIGDTAGQSRLLKLIVEAMREREADILAVAAESARAIAVKAAAAQKQDAERALAKLEANGKELSP